MDEEKVPEKDLERLSKAIINAIMNSNEVKKAISNLNSQDMLCSKSFMVLMMRMQSLADLSEIEENLTEKENDLNDFSKKAVKKAKRGYKSNKSQLIDGRKLTPKEIAFEEFYANKFREDQWLKKIKLFVDSNNSE